MMRELVFQQELALADAADKYLAQDFRGRRSGRDGTRSEFVALAGAARQRIAEASVTVLQELQVGTDYAERHRNDIRWADGTTTSEEVYIFATFAPDGRFASLDETPVPGVADGTFT